MAFSTGSVQKTLEKQGFFGAFPFTSPDPSLMIVIDQGPTLGENAAAAKCSMEEPSVKF
jgi:hypothetical protein